MIPVALHKLCQAHLCQDYRTVFSLIILRHFKLKILPSSSLNAGMQHHHCACASKCKWNQNKNNINQAWCVQRQHDAPLSLFHIDLMWILFQILKGFQHFLLFGCFSREFWFASQSHHVTMNLCAHHNFDAKHLNQIYSINLNICKCHANRILHPTQFLSTFMADTTPFHTLLDEVDVIFNWFNFTIPQFWFFHQLDLQIHEFFTMTPQLLLIKSKQLQSSHLTVFELRFLVWNLLQAKQHLMRHNKMTHSWHSTMHTSTIDPKTSKSQLITTQHSGNNSHGNDCICSNNLFLWSNQRKSRPCLRHSTSPPKLHSASQTLCHIKQLSSWHMSRSIVEISLTTTPIACEIGIFTFSVLTTQVKCQFQTLSSTVDQLRLSSTWRDWVSHDTGYGVGEKTRWRVQLTFVRTTAPANKAL